MTDISEEDGGAHYRVRVFVRKNGAIGTTYPIDIIAQANTPEAARELAMKICWGQGYEIFSITSLERLP